jgi:hypothetical protein
MISIVSNTTPIHYFNLIKLYPSNKVKYLLLATLFNYDFVCF